MLIKRALFFFFSSRRRHTRYWRDWSSDVCSSDLRTRRALCAPRKGPAPLSPPGRTGCPICFRRSEERRVGKECRSRWSPYPEKKKKKDGEKLSRRINTNVGYLLYSTLHL